MNPDRSAAQTGTCACLALVAPDASMTTPWARLGGAAGAPHSRRPVRHGGSLIRPPQLDGAISHTGLCVFRLTLRSTRQAHLLCRAPGVRSMVRELSLRSHRWLGTRIPWLKKRYWTIDSGFPRVVRRMPAAGDAAKPCLAGRLWPCASFPAEPRTAEAHSGAPNTRQARIARWTLEWFVRCHIQLAGSVLVALGVRATPWSTTTSASGGASYWQTACGGVLEHTSP